MASPNLSEIATTTLLHRSGQLADNVTKHNALLHRLKEKSRIRTVTGGERIVQELEYAQNSTYKRYSGYEILDISPSDVFTSAEFDWKQAAVAVTISGLEQLKNAGNERQIDLLESRINNAERTLVNNLAADVYSDGTADGGKQIGGLQALVPDDPTVGTVGGINRASWSFWRPVKFSGATDGGAAVSQSTIQNYMDRLWIQLVRGPDQPDLVVADNTFYQYYLSSLQAIQRVTDSKMADAGFASLKFMSADVVFDGGFGDNAPVNHMYFLNTQYLHFRPHKDRNMAPLDPDRFATNQDALVKLIGWAGNMTVSNSRLQGVLIA
ncbi:MAG: phage major capsid protein [Magnetococcales bacterium]|nr:phage major capsid protein [Magnetococcales bacterium]